jgi:hypothetical protein
MATIDDNLSPMTFGSYHFHMSPENVESIT